MCQSCNFQRRQWKLLTNIESNIERRNNFILNFYVFQFSQDLTILRDPQMQSMSEFWERFLTPARERLLHLWPQAMLWRLLFLITYHILMCLGWNYILYPCKVLSLTGRSYPRRYPVFVTNLSPLIFVYHRPSCWRGVETNETIEVLVRVGRIGIWGGPP